MVLVFLSVRLMPHTRRAALRWTASRRPAAVSDTESHDAEAYSKTGRTSCLYAVFLTFSEVVRTFLLMKPRVELPLAVTLSIYMLI